MYKSASNKAAKSVTRSASNRFTSVFALKTLEPIQFHPECRKCATARLPGAFYTGFASCNEL
jgi:hypothetical protein